jgi:hypothetical protein
MATAERPLWQFAARFRRGAFGWRSQPAIARVQEALAEIGKVKRKDPVLPPKARCCSWKRSRRHWSTWTARPGQLATPSTARSRNSSQSSPQHRLILLSVPYGWSDCGRRTRLTRYLTSKPWGISVKAVARAHRWFDELSTGKARSLAAIAAREGLAVRYVGRLIRLAFLAPDIVESIVEGRQPTTLTAEALTRRIELPLSWCAQRTALNVE